MSLRLSSELMYFRILSTAADYSIKENDFIVAMVQKKKPDPKKKEEPKAEEVKKEEVPAATTATNPPA